ncbi:hypothetical protein PLESTM_002075400 [Pleodorina starrii]|nr:hypothetical protein PLESTM_002075400 [Pleodorina starrii]
MPSNHHRIHHGKYDIAFPMTTRPSDSVIDVVVTPQYACHVLPISGPETSPGEEPGPQPAYPLAVSLDAVTKLGHYANCGTGSGNSLAHLDRYFGPVDARVSSAHSAGKLDLRSTIGDPTLDCTPFDGDAPCVSSLHCARPDAPSASGPCDIHGVCGAVCMHTVPLRSVFCDMRTPEQFAYYLLMLGHIIQQRPDLKHVYMDFGCRIASTWQRYVAKHPELPPEAAGLEIMVNWMHGNGHGVACQLTNSGRYRKGAGRRIGEEIEQLWSGTKPVAGLVRYMTQARRRDFVEAVFRSLSRKKFKKMVKLLEMKYRDTVKLANEGVAEVAKVVDAAARAGVVDLPAAAAEYVQSVVPTSKDAAQPDEAAWQVEYVLLRLREMELRALQGKAPSLAVVSSASAVALAAASTEAQVAKLRAALTKMEVAREMSPLERGKWKPGYPLFDAAVQRLKEREVQRCQARVETLVLEIHQTHAERELAGATDKDAKRSQARARRKRAQIRSMLEEMYVWQGVGGDGQEVVVRLTEQQIKQLYVPGELAPWCTPSSGAAAMRRHHGRLFHEADAALTRSREEVGFLRYEKSRLGTWLRKAALCVEAARQKKLGVCAGSVFLLDGHLRAMEALQSELTNSRIPSV